MELSVRGISKSFGASNVLEQVDFSIRGGEICALLGENGAGKSTLMNIIGGVLTSYSGEIFLDGQPVRFDSPADSLRAGIAFIHQELNLINDLTIYENMFLSAFPKKGMFLDRDTMIARSRAVFESLGIDMDVSAAVGTLDASYKQMVEIARALLSEASLIIMDEPTASLTGKEIDRIFQMMRRLRERGIAIIFISHKLNEVMEVCDRFTVLRNGTLIRSGSISDVTAPQLAAWMVGHDLTVGTAADTAQDGEELLRLEHLSDGKHFRDIGLSVRRGEILGVTGLLGDGRSELFGTVFGIRGSKYRGKIILGGREIHPTSPVEALRCGMAYLPRNRKENGIIADLSILDNGTSVTWTAYRRAGLQDRAAQKTAFSAQAEKLKIRMSDCEKRITTLSGGNQQKTILARWLLSEPKVLILDNPTQGVDVGAKEEIYTIIEKLAADGMAVIVLSPEAQEIMRVCGRCVVLCRGEIVGELERDEMDEQTLMVLATGAGRGKKKDGTESE